LVVVVAEARELISVSDPIAPFAIRTEFDRDFAFNWLSGGVSEVPVIRSEP
jgi:hypothetical protein